MYYIFLLSILLILTALLAFLLAIYFIFLIDLIRIRVPFVPSSRKAIKKIVDLIPVDKDKIIYDLGCGDGRVLIAYTKKYGVRGIGYELGWLAYSLARFNVWLTKTPIKIYKQNFYKVNLSQADIVFCYLLPATLKNIEKKLIDELKPGAKIISLDFQFPNWSPTQKIELTNKAGKIFIYTKK